MKIGELALAAQTQVETIRYYEREGLLPQAPRSEGNYRIYGADHVERLIGREHRGEFVVVPSAARMTIRETGQVLRNIALLLDEARSRARSCSIASRTASGVAGGSSRGQSRCSPRLAIASEIAWSTAVASMSGGSPTALER